MDEQKEKIESVYLSSLLSIIRISTFFAPTALHRLAVDVGVVYRHDGVRGRLLGGKPEIEREGDLGLSPGRVFRGYDGVGVTVGARWCVQKEKSPFPGAMRRSFHQLNRTLLWWLNEMVSATGAV